MRDITVQAIPNKISLVGFSIAITKRLAKITQNKPNVVTLVCQPASADWLFRRSL